VHLHSSAVDFGFKSHTFAALRDAPRPKLMSGEIQVSNEKIADHISQFFLES
jgi:hypothetical protein